MEKWKMISAILFTLLIISVAGWVWMISLGLQIIEKEEACSIQCYDEGAIAYTLYGDACYCTDKNGEYVKVETT